MNDTSTPDDVKPVKADDPWFLKAPMPPFKVVTKQLDDVIAQRDIMAYVFAGGEVTDDVRASAIACGLGEAVFIDQRHEVARLRRALERLCNLKSGCQCELSNDEAEAWEYAHQILNADRSTTARRP